MLPELRKEQGLVMNASMRSNLTLNYGVRYDVEYTPTFPAVNDISQKAQDALGILKGIPRDTNNIAPRFGQ